MDGDQNFGRNEFAHYYSNQRGTYALDHAAFEARQAAFQDARSRASEAGDHQLADTIGKMGDKHEAGYRFAQENERRNDASSWVNRSSDRAEEARYAEKRDAHQAKADEHLSRYSELRDDLDADPRADEAARAVRGEAMEPGVDADQWAVEYALEVRADEMSDAHEDAQRDDLEPSQSSTAGKEFDWQSFASSDWQRDCLEADRAGRPELSDAMESVAQRDLHLQASRSFAKEAQRAHAEGRTDDKAEYERQAKGHLDAHHWAKGKVERTNPEVRAEAENKAKGWAHNQPRKAEPSKGDPAEPTQAQEPKRPAIEDGPRNRRRPEGSSEPMPGREPPKSPPSGGLSGAEIERRQNYSKQAMAPKPSTPPTVGQTPEDEKKKGPSR